VASENPRRVTPPSFRACIEAGRPKLTKRHIDIAQKVGRFEPFARVEIDNGSAL